MTVENIGPIAIQIAMGIGLAASTGLRAFLPLLVVSVAGKLEWVPLADRFEWLATWPAIVVFGVAVAAELLSDKVPLIDNLLDVVQVWVKPVAGTLLATAVLTDLAPLEATVLGIMTGASTAGAVHIVKAKIRVLSSVVTSGIGNPVLSLAEDAVSLIGSIAAIAIPLVALGAALLGLVLLVVFLRRFHLRASRA